MPTEAFRPRHLCAADATVIRNEPLCREHVAIEFALSNFPKSEPGQFLQLRCADDDHSPAVLEDWREGSFPALTGDAFADREAFLRRPFSIADHSEQAGRTHLTVISRAVGAGTRWLERLAVGDVLSVTGPLGRPFVMPAGDAPLILVGGGVGIPPLLYLARRLADMRRENVTLIFGATARDLLPVRLVDEPDRDGAPRPCVELPGGGRYGAIITTDDGSAGLRGYVTAALAGWHAETETSSPPLVLACGPEPMLRAVAAETRKRGMDCQLCIERIMGCGLGTCLSCVVRVRAPERPAGWRWALSCSDGPVFSRDVLLDDAPAART